MRVSHEPVYVYRRRRVGAVLVVLIVGTLAGFGAAELGSRILGGAEEPSAAGTVSAAASDAIAGASSTPASTPEASPTSTGTLTPTPAPSEAAFDLTARSIDRPGSLWVVVNKRRPLDPEDFAPSDLVSVAEVPGGATMREDAAAAMTALYRAAMEEDAGFAITTAYRDHALQESLYDGYVSSRGQEQADRFSARPGYSEHQTGLAADIRAGGCDLTACFADTAAGRYVASHAWEHGFIVRYPDGAEDVTGYIYEPWHLRYVGTALAAYLHEEGIATLEEAFDLPAAPDYP
ncbi:M15 family metallopeptidase [Demequina iriomotensis]|uniref:M15 family metallopeptidase n=1 Tax=Demequina iriomotensis TaxID=1536641 RepID=UPI000782F6A6|nr:M15 family metallopeptidase [Demequina iriomotensis]